MMTKKYNISGMIRILSIILGIVGCVHIGWKFYTNWNDIVTGFDTIEEKWWLIVVELLMMLLNVTLESIRWRMLDNERENNGNLWSSTRTICESIAMSMATPAGIGEHLGKMRRSKEKRGTIVASLFGSIIQTSVIATMGIVGIVMTHNGDENNYIMIFVIVMVAIVMTCLLAKKFSRKAREVISQYSVKRVFEIASINTIRYIVFAFQLYIMVKMDIMVMDMELVYRIMEFYFIVTLIPSALGGLTDLGIRGSMGTLIIGSVYGEAWCGIATIMVWVINRVIPTILGTISLLKS